MGFHLSSASCGHGLWLCLLDTWVVDGGFKLKLARNIEITGEIQYQNISKPGFVQVHWGMNRKTDSWLKDVKGCLFFFSTFHP